MNTEVLRLPCSCRKGDSLEVSEWYSRYNLWLGITQDDSTRCMKLSREDAETLRDRLNEWLGEVPYSHAFTDEEYDEAVSMNQFYDEYVKPAPSQPVYNVDALTRAIERLQLAVDANTRALYTPRPGTMAFGGIAGHPLGEQFCSGLGQAVQSYNVGDFKHG